MKKILLSIILAFLFVIPFVGASASAESQLDSPEILDMISTNQGVKITWDPVKGAERYRVFYYGRNGWTGMGDTDKTSFVDTVVGSGKTYTYTVRCINSNGSRYVSDYNHKGWRYTYNMDTPMITDFKSIDKGVKISWNTVEGAERYRVFYYGRNGWTSMGDTTNTSFIDTVVGSGKTYTYTVRCVKSDGSRHVSDYYHKGWKYTYNLDTPRITKLESVDKGVHISWEPVKGAARYRVYYYGRNGWTSMGNTTDTSFIDTVVGSGKTYTYTVRCVKSDGTRLISDYNHSGWRYTYNLDTPQINKTESVDNGVKITWDPVAGATRYRVYYHGRNGWRSMGDSTNTSFIDTDVRYGNTYTYTVRCVKSDGSRLISDFVRNGWKHTHYCSTPSLKTINACNDGITLTWDTVPSASQYRVYRKIADSDWMKVTDTRNTSYIDESVESETTYTYTVRCLNESGKVISDYDKSGLTAFYHVEPTEPPTEAPTEAPLDIPANIQAEMVDNGSVTYDTVGKWEIWKEYRNNETGAAGVSDRFEYIANAKDYVGEEPLEKERYIDSYVEYSDDGSKATVHWNKTEDKEGYSFLSYHVAIFHKTHDEDNIIGEMNYDKNSKTKAYEWQYCDYQTHEWKLADASGETYCTFELPVLSERLATARLSWEPVDRATEYIVEMMKNDKWVFEATAPSPNYEFNPNGNMEYQFRIKAVNNSGTSSPYAYKTLTTESKFVEDEEAYTYEEPVYERRYVTVCNQCGAHITNSVDAHFKANIDTCWSYRVKYLNVQIGTATIEVPAKGHWETIVVKEAWTEKKLVREAGYY